MKLDVPARKLWLILGSCLFCFLSLAQKKATLPVENGVPENLANFRKQVVSDLHYAIHFHVPAAKAESIPAEETITFNWKKNEQPLQIDFKSVDTSIHAVVVNDRRVKKQFQNEHLLVESTWLHEGLNTVTIYFTAGELSLNRNADFLYTLLVPDRARTVFPCFDQPSLKAKFQLTLTLPKDWKALANAPLADSVVSADTKTYRYEESDLFSTYLFSFVAGRFEARTQKTGEREMQFLFRETDSNKIRLSMDTIFGWHEKAIRFLEDYTQIPFPFRKLDFAGIPDFQYGGMEHVGAIDYKGSTLFLDSAATKDQENARSNLIAHETAHMWFGDLVTMQWFNDVWMKEVFANFMADKITQGTQNSSNYELKFLLTHFPRAYAVDRTAGANPIRQPLSNLQEAGTLYGPIIYDKAPVMMRQLERLVGVENFRDGLRDYLKQYSYGNATWPDLIGILDKRTPADLLAWNKVWVNTPGRPQLHYSLQKAKGKIARLTITQKGEQGQSYLLPQFFELALVYGDRVEELTVNMNKMSVVVGGAEGRPLPDYILFNSSGQGYGVFPVDPNMQHLDRLPNPVMRAAASINLYENMLNGSGRKPAELLTTCLALLEKEPEELTSRLLTGYCIDIFWRLLTPVERQQLVQRLETAFWQMMQNEALSNKKKILFQAYQNLALSKPALDTLYAVWKEQTPPRGVKLSEDDYTALALNLALKEYPDTAILPVQQDRISNPDRKQRLQFLVPALSADVATRDAFFASLKNIAVRKKEAWVQDALAYLHHPLRARTSIRYLKESLDLLQEIQLTGDIFFPAGWLGATFGAYQSSEAAAIVRDFLKAHPAYNPKLRAKILQAADPLFRAERLLKEKEKVAF
ncbi:M1 family metallopeptidase [Flavisolibacter nicotianae]|uniref:M1 family metallopeptidase n=1 Tax=Flavisolibacter nicotianae TaxID=2364882 RepID=UPI000EB2C19D|nr:M1 family aminopeptidase [Flavisolibacter nicotianae]